jgi:hypothetical protein
LTIQSPVARQSFACNGVSTVFPVNIQAYAATDFLVLATNAAGTTSLVLNSDYTLVASGTLAPPFWTMTTTVIYPTLTTLQAILNPTETQLTQFVQGQAFPSLAVQTVVDRVTQMNIRQSDILSRAIVAPDGDVAPQMLLPAAQVRKSTNLGFDVNGNLSFNLALASGTLSTATLLPFLPQSVLGAILYPQTAAEIAAGVVPVNFFIAPGNVLRYGTNTTPGTTDMSVAIQTAINVCRTGGARYISFQAGVYLVNTTIDMTLMSDVEVEGFGARQGVQILGGTTASWVIDCTGMFRCKLKNLMIGNGAITTSKGGILLARTNAQQALYNCFDGIYMQQYNLSAPSQYRAIGWAIIGSEENTFHDCKTFANTPWVISTTYADISANYPSPYQNANVSNSSCGVNTWSGESASVTFDLLFPVFNLNGCNTVDFGNHYCANVNIGSPGASYKCLSVYGGTLEGVRGQFKLESIQTVVSIDQFSCQVMGWDIRCTYGAGITATNGVFEINTGNTNVWQGNLHSFKLGVFWENPASPTNKPLILYSGTVNAGATVPSISNVLIETNQTFSQGSYVPLIPNIFTSIVNSFDLKFVDVNYWFNAHRQIKRFASALSLGSCAASPGGTGSAIATITFPTIVAGGEAKTYQVRVRGMLSTVNEPGGGGGTNIAVTPFDTCISGWSSNSGTITTSSGVSDLVFTPSNSLLSVNAGLFQPTGVNVTQGVASRVVTLTGKPYGTGASITVVTGFAIDMEIEAIFSGRINELPYLT